MSLGKQDPPKPGPACRNFPAMRRSSPIPRDTSCTSAPHFSQRSAISLMKVILVARKALDAYLMSSAERRPVKRIGVSLMNSGRYSSRITRRARSSSVPITMRSGRLKSSIAAPSRKNSGSQLANDGVHLVVGPDRNGRFDDDNGIALDFGGNSARGVIHVREIGKTVAPSRRSSHSQKDRVGCTNRGCGFGGKRQAADFHVACNQRIQARLEDRQASASQLPDFRRIAVDAGYHVSEIREAGPGDEPHVTGTNHCYSHEVLPAGFAFGDVFDALWSAPLGVDR